MKTYITANIQIISISRDIITMSDPKVGIHSNQQSLYYEGGEFAPGRKNRYADDYTF